MKKLNSYMIKKFTGPFVAVFFVVIFALSMQFLWVYIDDLVGKGLGMGVIFEFMGWAACTLIPMSAPLATLLASIMTLGGLGERNELLAMKAAGISLQRIIAPIIVLSFLISIGAFFAANNLVPYSYNKIYTLKEDIANTRDEIKIPTGIFYDGIDGYILRVADRNDETKMMYDLVIYDHTGNMGNTNVTVADSGRIEITPDKGNLIFDLYNGCSYSENNTMSYRDTSLELNRLNFNDQRMIISLENYQFTRSDDDRFSDEVMSRNLIQLAGDRDSLSRELDTLIRTQISRYNSSMGLQHLFQLDTLNKAEMTGSLDLSQLGEGLTKQQKLNAARKAIDNSDFGIEQAENFSRESYRYVAPIRRIDIESFRKFTLSLACLLFFFIGAPLGAIIRKGGLGTPVVISVFFYLIYYIIDIIGKKLAKNGTISPFAGTIISTMVLLPIGIFLTRKSTQDSTLFNLDSYKAFFNAFWKKVSKGFYRCINVFRKGGAKIRIVYMGTPEFAVAPLDKLIQNKYKVVGVVTAVDKPSGRGLTMNQSAVKKYALEHNLPVLQPEKLKDPEFIAQLKALKANLFVVVAFRMLPKEVWQMPVLGTFNLHASLLPQYRGAAPINWAIINGERFTGVTTFMIDEQIDTGKILFQRSCSIEEYDDAGSLHDKLMAMGADTVLETVDAIENRKTKPYSQASAMGLGNKVLRPAPKINKEDCHIDWTRSARAVNRLIRGMSPYPGAFTSLVREDIAEDGTVTSKTLNAKVYETYIIKCEDNSIPVGTITTDNKTYMEVKCGKDALRIESLQLSGKKRMDIGSFLIGFRDAATYKFV